MRRANEIEELKAIIWKDGCPIHLNAFKKAVRQAWKRAFGEACQSCKCHMHFEPKFRNHRHYATIDHILARSLGGFDKLENIQVICRECNNRKSAIEYRQNPC